MLYLQEVEAALGVILAITLAIRFLQSRQDALQFYELGASQSPPKGFVFWFRWNQNLRIHSVHSGMNQGTLDVVFIPMVQEVQYARLQQQAQLRHVFVLEPVLFEAKDEPTIRQVVGFIVIRELCVVILDVLHLFFTEDVI